MSSGDKPKPRGNPVIGLALLGYVLFFVLGLFLLPRGTGTWTYVLVPLVGALLGGGVGEVVRRLRT